MIKPEGSETQIGMDYLLPYLNPEYWDGHTLGQGDLTPTGTMVVSQGREVKLAKNALIDYINRPGPRFPLETFTIGQTFEPNAYNPGTVVAFRHELLDCKGSVIVPELPVDLPSAPTNAFLPQGKNFWGSRISIRDEEDVLWYRSTAMWGVVTQKRRSEDMRLTQIGPHSIFGTPPLTSIIGPLLSRNGPVVIGGIGHRKRPGFERIERVRLLEVCANGRTQAEGSKSAIFSFFGRLATGGSSSP